MGGYTGKRTAVTKDGILEELKNDGFVKICWMWTLLKIGVLAIGTIIVFLYVVISCVIDKM